MPKYSDEVRMRALEMMEANGVKKTAEALDITAQTLYKWRNAASGEISRMNGVSFLGSEAVEDARALVADYDAHVTEENDRLVEENAKLRVENNRLRNALKVLLN